MHPTFRRTMSSPVVIVLIACGIFLVAISQIECATKQVSVSPFGSMLAGAQELSPVRIQNDNGIIRVQFRRVLPRVAEYMGSAVNRIQNNFSLLFGRPATAQG
jgi:hypothetical protein